MRARRQRGQHREGGQRTERGARRGHHGSGSERETRAQGERDCPDDRVRHVTGLGEQQQAGAYRPGRQGSVQRAEPAQVSGERRARQRGARGGQDGQRPGHSDDDRARPGREQSPPAAPRAPGRGRRPGPRPPGRAGSSPPPPAARKAPRGPTGRLRASATARIAYGTATASAAAATWREPAGPAGAYYPAPGPPEQRAGQQDQAERQQPDPAGSGQHEADVVADEPAGGRGAQHAGQPEPGVRRGDPADHDQQHQDDQADPREPRRPRWRPGRRAAARRLVARGVSPDRGRVRRTEPVTKLKPGNFQRASARRRAGPDAAGAGRLRPGTPWRDPGGAP